MRVFASMAFHSHSDVVNDSVHAGPNAVSELLWSEEVPRFREALLEQDPRYQAAKRLANGDRTDLVRAGLDREESSCGEEREDRVGKVPARQAAHKMRKGGEASDSGLWRDGGEGQRSEEAGGETIRASRG